MLWNAYQRYAEEERSSGAEHEAHVVAIELDLAEQDADTIPNENQPHPLASPSPARAPLDAKLLTYAHADCKPVVDWR